MNLKRMQASYKTLLQSALAPPWGSKRWCGGESTHLPCDAGSNPGIDAICGLSLLLVLSLAQRGFSPGTLVFPSPQKPTFPNSNLTRNQVDEEPLCGCATSKSLFIYLLFILFIYMTTIGNKHPKFEWRGGGRGVDSFVLWSYHNLFEKQFCCQLYNSLMTSLP